MKIRIYAVGAAALLMASGITLSGCATNVAWGDRSVLQKRNQTHQYQKATNICSTLQVVANNSKRPILVRFDNSVSSKKEASGWVAPGTTKKFAVRTFASAVSYIAVDNNGQPASSKVLDSYCPHGNSKDDPFIVGHVYRKRNSYWQFMPGNTHLR